MDGDGQKVIAARSEVVDALLRNLWTVELEREPLLAKVLAIVAVGGYGRAQLYPYSDIDILFCNEKGDPPKDLIRRVTQTLWDLGLRVSPVTRSIGDCGRFDPSNAEFGLSLLDRRFIGGDAGLMEKLNSKIITKMISRDPKSLRGAMLELTRARHAKYGDTLFHLEPNVKDCPGGLRDANVSGWLARLRNAGEAMSGDEEENEGLRFFAATRCFLHYRHQRDDNVLAWLDQDGAAEAQIGLGGPSVSTFDAAYWMRTYFRHARAIERRLLREMEVAGLRLRPSPQRKIKISAQDGLRLRNGCLEFAEDHSAGSDDAGDASRVLALFATMARTGAAVAYATEDRIAESIPQLSAVLEEGPRLWQALRSILEGEFAGRALRAMHTLGVLDLILPEFHGIDALVIRDAYHRYTVDEHTFLVIDTLHELRGNFPKDAPDWRVKLGQMARELANPALLMLAALLHDTGKGRAGEAHAMESAHMARSVLNRLEMDSYDANLVLHLIETHLDMSAALRRDIFDGETVRAFAGKVQTHEALRMLTLFTYADIQAVHPDALTPWKAENLWRLEMKTANQIDRSVDEDRVHMGFADERVDRVLSLLPGREAEIRAYLEGFPERYLATRSPEEVCQHLEMSLSFSEEEIQILLLHGEAVSTITLVTRDRPSLLSALAGALAAWGMNVITADGFANANGVVVDSFRFTDTFRTLELNVEERLRFVQSVRDAVSGKESVEKMLSARRRGRKKAPRFVVDTRVDFDDQASSHSTLVQVVAQDVPGLLRAISRTLSSLKFNVEVALVDTEGETAIDVFYLTHDGSRLSSAQKEDLGSSLIQAIATNALSS